MSDRRKGGRDRKRERVQERERERDRGRQQREKDRNREREEKEREPESLASTLPLLFASAADVVVRKGGKKISIKL